MFGGININWLRSFLLNLRMGHLFLPPFYTYPPFGAILGSQLPDSHDIARVPKTRNRSDIVAVGELGLPDSHLHWSRRNGVFAAWSLLG
jgi:hypothetical protein